MFGWIRSVSSKFKKKIPGRLGANPDRRFKAKDEDDSMGLLICKLTVKMKFIEK